MSFPITTSSHYVKMHFLFNIPEVIEDNIIQDHRILTRTQIKEMSAKIVEANSKKDDF